MICGGPVRETWEENARRGRAGYALPVEATFTEEVVFHLNFWERMSFLNGPLASNGWRDEAMTRQRDQEVIREFRERKQ